MTLLVVKGMFLQIKQCCVVLKYLEYFEVLHEEAQVMPNLQVATELAYGPVGTPT